MLLAGACERERTQSTQKQTNLQGLAHVELSCSVVSCLSQKARLAGILLFVGLTLCVLAFGNVLECIEIESK